MNAFDFEMGDGEALGSIFARAMGCAGCGTRDGLKPFPPDDPNAKKYCGLCALKKAVEIVDARKKH